MEVYSGGLQWRSREGGLQRRSTKEVYRGRSTEGGLQREVYREDSSYLGVGLGLCKLDLEVEEFCRRLLWLLCTEALLTQQLSVGLLHHTQPQSVIYILLRTSETVIYILLRTSETAFYILLRTSETAIYILLRTSETVICILLRTSAGYLYPTEDF